MQKNKCVPETYFERYSFPLPLAKLFGQKRRAYIYSELVKRHPCFSENFCYDSKLNLGKKGFFLDVLVIDRLSFLHFKKKVGLQGLLGLRFTNVRGIRFISSVGRGLGLGLLIGLLLGGIAMFAFSVERTAGKKGLGAGEFAGAEAVNLMGGGVDGKAGLTQEGAGEAKGELTQEVALGQSVFELISLLKEKGGRLNSFSWNCNGMKEVVSLELAGIYPEEVMRGLSDKCELELSSVVYLEGRPVFSVTLKNKIKAFSLSELGAADDFRSRLRDELRKMQCVIKEEKASGCSVVFDVQGNVDEVLGKIGEISDEEGLFLGNFRIVRGKDGGAEVSLKFMETEQSLCQRNVLKMLSEGDFFYKKRKTQGGSASGAIIKNEIKNKVGEVRLKNGEKVVYYKNDEGKMCRMVTKE